MHVNQSINDEWVLERQTRMSSGAQIRIIKDASDCCPSDISVTNRIYLIEFDRGERKK